MATPQPGIFIEASGHHHYLEYTVAPGGDAEDLNAAVANVAALCVRPSPNQAAHIVLAFGPDLWARLSPAAMPEGLRPFEAIEGTDGHALPATQRDIFVWVHGDRLDDVFDTAMTVQGLLKPVASLAFDDRGFTFHDSRDLTGFIDGSANPKADAARTASLIPDGRTDAGGAFVRTVLLNAGTDDGVAVGQAAVNAEGLVGRVVEVGRRSARILLLTDLNSRVPVVVERSRVPAILAGDNSDHPRLSFTPVNAVFEPGDRIVTSGHGGMLPPGLPIGEVISTVGGVARVRPYVDWTALEYLRVLDFTLPGVLPATRAAGPAGPLL